jgi:hypothetical protein
MTGPKKKPSDSEAGVKSVSDEAVLKVAKEIIVKFIEVGRLSPSNVNEAFQEIYKTVRDTVHS